MSVPPSPSTDKPTWVRHAALTRNERARALFALLLRKLDEKEAAQAVSK